MDRKYLWGCLGAAALAVIALFVAFYFIVLRPTQAVMPDLKQVAALSSLNDGIVETTEFTPPATGEITPEQLERFARVQARMRDRLGNDYTLLKERAENLHGLQFGEGDTRAKALTVQKAILLFKDLGPVLTAAKEAQIQGINEERFTLTEYRWVRESFYRALGFSRVNAYLENFEAFAAGEASNRGDTESEAAEPLANRERAAHYSDSAEEWFPFLVFGL